MSYWSAKWWKPLGLNFGPPAHGSERTCPPFYAVGWPVIWSLNIWPGPLLTVVLSAKQCTHTHTHTHTTGLVYAPNSDHTHNKQLWSIIRNFNQVQAIIPWWWILSDPIHVGVIFNVCLLDFYTTQILTSTTVPIECISWLIKVLIIMMHGGKLKLMWTGTDG